MRFVVEVAGALAVGRDADNALVVADRQVSRHHARFDLDGDALTIADLASTHGTLLNGRRIDGTARLADGDVVQLGGVLLEAHDGPIPTPRPGESLWQTASAAVEPTARAPTAAARKLRVLFDVGRLIASLDDTDRALERVLDLTLEALDCTHAAIALGGPGGRRITRARGTPEDIAVPPAVIAQVIARGEAVLVRDGRSALAAPLAERGVLYVDDHGRAGKFGPDDLDFIAALARLAAVALDKGDAVRRASIAVELGAGVPPLHGDSDAMRKLRVQIAKCAGADAAVLVHGETGTGKELVAAHLHAASRRAQRPFVAVNCAAIPETLIESELFGHVKGAFTGAEKPRRGRFACAHTGTLFLDEIGDLALPAQAKLLRVLETGEVHAVGADEPQEVDVRIVAASHKDLHAEVAAGRFREDLFYRLDVLAIDVPPLRARGDDVRMLADVFRAEAAARLARPVVGITAAASAALRAYAWPGNVRQLRNEIERAVLLCEGVEIDAGDLRLRAAPAAPVDDRLERGRWQIAEAPAGAWAPAEAVERQAIADALRAAGGNVEVAARAIGVSRATMYRKVARFGLQRLPRDDA